MYGNTRKSRKTQQSTIELKEIPFILLENHFGNHYKNNNVEDIIKFLFKQNFKKLWL